MIGVRKFRTRSARKRERMRVALIGTGIAALAGALICALVYVAHLPSLRVGEFTATTDGSLDASELSAAMGEAVRGTLFGMLPNDSVISVRTGALAAVLMNEFPRAAHVDVRRVGFNAVHANVEERTPEAFWCGDVVPPIDTVKATSGSDDLSWGSCYLVDGTGYIYAAAPRYSGDVLPRYYGSLSRADPVRSQVADAPEFARWQAFYKRVSDDGHTVRALLLADERDVEVYLATGIRVLFSRDDDTQAMERRLLATLASDAIDRNRTVSYIDMRFGTKVFVKYADEVSGDAGDDADNVLPSN